MKQNILLASLTLVMCFIAMFSIKYTPIKRAEQMKEKLKAFFHSTAKEAVTFIAMFLSVAAVSLMLVLFYENNTVLFNIKRMVLVSLLWIAAYFDFKSYRIPNKLILLGLALRTVILMFELVFEREEILYICVSELIAAAVLLVMSFVAMFVVKNGLGMGDAKLFAVMGLYLGIQGSLSAVFMSLIAIFFISVILMIRKKKKRKDSLPFAPAILVGTTVAVSIFGA